MLQQSQGFESKDLNTLRYHLSCEKSTLRDTNPRKVHHVGNPIRLPNLRQSEKLFSWTFRDSNPGFPHCSRACYHYTKSPFPLFITQLSNYKLEQSQTS